MGRARELASTVSTGGPLNDGQISVSEVIGLQAALDAKTTLVSGTAITTSGQAAYEFTGIPASAKNIKLLFRNVSASGLSTGGLQVQLGTAGGLVTTGYTGTVQTLNSTTVASSASLTTSFLITATGSDAFLFTGMMELCEIDSNVWVHRTHFGASGSRAHIGVGELALGAELTTIRVFMGVGTFDGGTINIMYE